MNTASEYFGAMSADYDSLIQRAVPRYDEMIERIVAYLPDAATNVLELGCGTGNLTCALAGKYADATLTLVDAAPAMLQASRERLEPARDVRLVEARFEDLDLEPSSFDVISSCIALHHVSDKRALFAQLHGLLRPGGVLLFGDQLRGGTDRFHGINWNAMERFWHLPDHLDSGEVTELRQHADEHDYYVSIVEQLRLLESAGFDELDVVWRNWMWGIVHGRRRAGSMPR